MKKKLLLYFIILCLFSACGVDNDPAGNVSDLEFDSEVDLEEEDSTIEEQEENSEPTLEYSSMPLLLEEKIYNIVMDYSFETMPFIGFALIDISFDKNLKLLITNPTMGRQNKRMSVYNIETQELIEIEADFIFEDSIALTPDLNINGFLYYYVDSKTEEKYFILPSYSGSTNAGNFELFQKVFYNHDTNKIEIYGSDYFDFVDDFTYDFNPFSDSDVRYINEYDIYDFYEFKTFNEDYEFDDEIVMREIRNYLSIIGLLEG